MAMTVVWRVEVTPFLSTSPMSITTASWTPNANKLLVAIVSSSDETNANLITDNTSFSGGGLTWTKRLSTQYDVGGRSYLHQIWTAEGGASPSSMTCTWSCSAARVASSCKGSMFVVEVSEYNTDVPIGATMSEACASDGADTGTLSQSPTGASCIIGARITGATTAVDIPATPGTGWTEIGESFGAAGWAGMQTQYKLNHDTTTVSWDDINAHATASTDGSQWLLGIEIRNVTDVLTSALNFPSTPSNGQVYALSGITYVYNSSVSAWQKQTASIPGSISFITSEGGSELSVGPKGTIEIPYDFTITGWTMIADQSGSANVDLWSRDYSTTLPTQANSVTDNIGMTLSTATANQSTAISNWRMNKINAGNVITYNVQSCSTITRLGITLFGKKE